MHIILTLLTLFFFEFFLFFDIWAKLLLLYVQGT